ncbi:MAG: hypothetical protein WAS21_12060 [Geminicoccaceae bacterium]
MSYSRDTGLAIDVLPFQARLVIGGTARVAIVMGCVAVAQAGGAWRPY